jgi:cytochrome c oxidase subunit 4
MSKNKNASASHDQSRDDHRPNVKLYIGVFAALMICTLLTVLVSKFHLPRPQAIALGLAIALVKASLVGAIFMHLWGEAKLIHKFLYVTVFFAVIMIIPMIDFALTSPRQLEHADVAAQHPDEGGEHAAATPAPAETPAPTPAPAAKAAAKGKKKK